MKGSRGLLFWTAVTLVAIGALRGVIVAFVWHVRGTTIPGLTAGNILVALVWLPIAYCILRVLDAPVGRVPRGLLLVFLGAASLVLEPLTVAILAHLGTPTPPYVRRVLGRLDTNALFFFALVGAGWAAAARRRQAASEVAATRLQTALADAQLHVLTLQLHPHFLFNALNLISQLAYESVEAAQRTVANLRALLVESLRHAVHREVELRDELSFLRAYLEIQQARFRDRLRVFIDVPPELEDAAVPHLVLQPLVENAILHGLQRRASVGRLDIAARRTGDRIILSISDDGVGLTAPLREGLGLTNTRLRLDQLFGTDHELTIARGARRGTVVTLNIPYRRRTYRETGAGDDPSETAIAESHTSRVFQRVPSWLQVVAGWLAVAVIWTELSAALPGGTAEDFSWSATLTAYVINAILWMLFTPLVVRIARRLELGGQHFRRALPWHAVAALGTAVAHTGAWLLVLYAIRSSQYIVMLRSVFGWGLWDLVAYVAIVALATIVSYTARTRDARLEMERARVRIASARVATLRLRLQPAVLLNALDALGRVVAIDARESEATIARMGDLLRMLLSRSEREFVSLEEDLELLHAYLDVVNSPRPTSAISADLPRIDPLPIVSVPAMLFPTIAAAMHGDMELLRLELHGDRLSIAVRSAGKLVDAYSLRACADRLDKLYLGRARWAIEHDANGRTIVELEIPTQDADSNADTATPLYDVASA